VLDVARTKPVTRAVQAAKRALDQADPERPSQALPFLREAAEQLTVAIDEAMAAVILDEGGTLRQAGTLAGLSENAVGPRLARTEDLGAYSSETGRVTATGVTRALYDLEQGRHQKAAEAPAQPAMRFRARRPTN
jgi:acyl-CoA reductase-like NAD-dependent aldehyde dehydrogenase